MNKNASTDIFTEIKQRILLADVLVKCGVPVQINRNVNCPLPMHDDKTASFKYYQNTDSFWCFGCGKGGTVIDFIATLHGETPLDACKRLDVDFGLGIFDGDYKPTLTDGEAYRAAQETISCFLTEANGVFRYLCQEHSIAEWTVKNIPPKLHPDGSFETARIFDTCTSIPYASLNGIVRSAES